MRGISSTCTGGSARRACWCSAWAAWRLSTALLRCLLHKVKRSALIALCVALVALFCVDQVYSHFYPNEGEGITDEVVYKVNDARVSPDGEAFV